MPPAPDRAVVDRQVRERAVSALDTTFLVEAGAGTGKTRVLVDRYVRCVLDPVSGAGDVRTVAAITFTEKAAGELRQRVREEFETLAATAVEGSREAETIAAALDALDDAPISTIHGFAGRLLREFPVEAGVDPAFEQLDALASDIEGGRLWEEWLALLAGEDHGDDDAHHGPRASAGLGARAWLRRLLLAGVRLDDLRALAIGPRSVFGERYDVDPMTEPPSEPDLAAALGGLAGPLAALREHCAAACLDESDKGLAAATGLVDACDVLIARPPAGVDALAAKLADLPVRTSASAPGGAKASWDAARGGKEELQARYRALVAAIAAARDLYAAYLTGLAVAVADAFARWAGETQIALGRLDFTDLLGRLRDLLLSDLDARRALQRRFRFLLVDEFQDTDPLQAEIVLYLCEREPRAGSWRDVELEPGKLFVVGDPKQSIYRFRRADITLYDEVKALVGGQPGGTGVVTAISQNFRTTPRLVRWVNAVFGDVFDDDAAVGRQPRYQPVEAYRPHDDGVPVAVVLGREYGARGAGEADAGRADEARAVADLLVRMHGDEALRWQVQDRDAPSTADEGERRRPPRWGDIALLFRATTGLETYEQALREAGVPYRVEGGKTYFARREVADALLCLRAADDPSDGPALYGALHSSLVGFSDDDLVLFWAAGGRFDLFAEQSVEGHDGVLAALDTLRALHGRRFASEPHELVEELLRRVHAREFVAATGSGAAQALANLEKLVDRARAFGEAGGGGLGAFLLWAADAGDAAGEQESQVDDDADVVRVLTIHKAKGLEYPIVVLVGAARSGGGGGGEPLVDRANRRLEIKLHVDLPGGVASDLEPDAYRALREREKEMEASELRRLLYVATTRARDRLVLTCFGKLTTAKGEPAAGVMLAPARGALPVPGPEAADAEALFGDALVLPPGEPGARSARGTALEPAALLREREAWLAARAELLVRAARPAPATSPSALELVDEEVRAGGPGAPAGRAGALALGTAVHRVMELCDLADASSLPAIAAAVADELGRPELAERTAALAGACWASAPARAAAASPERHRELAVGALIEGVVLSGAVDLLYRDGPAWVIVDYKTDGSVDGDALRERYTPQGAAYALAVEAATGDLVREVVFVAASAGGLALTVPVDDALRERARAAIRQAAAEARAVDPGELTVPPG